MWSGNSLGRTLVVIGLAVDLAGCGWVLALVVHSGTDVSLWALAPALLVIGIGTGGSAAETMGLSVGKVARIATLESMAVSLRRLLGRESIRLDNGTDARLAWLDHGYDEARSPCQERHSAA